MYNQVNKYTAKYFTDHGWMDKSIPRDCVDLLF